MYGWVSVVKQYISVGLLSVYVKQNTLLSLQQWLAALKANRNEIKYVDWQQGLVMK